MIYPAAIVLSLTDLRVFFIQLVKVTMLKLVGKFVLFVAVSIGLVGKIRPNLFLKVRMTG